MDETKAGRIDDIEDILDSTTVSLLHLIPIDILNMLQKISYFYRSNDIVIFRRFHEYK